MKGKGSLTTYWLSAADTNPVVNEEGLVSLDAEVKQVLYNADFGTKERCSKKQMESFSPRKMQKVALSLDKLAMDVLKRTTRMNKLDRESAVPELAELAEPRSPRRSRPRSNSINLADLSEESKQHEATEQVYETLADIVQRFSGICEDDVKQEIAKALSSSFHSFDFSQEEMIDITDLIDESDDASMSAGYY